MGLHRAHLLRSLWLRAAMVLRQLLLNTLQQEDTRLLLDPHPDPFLSLGMVHPNNPSTLVKVSIRRMEVGGEKATVISTIHVPVRIKCVIRSMLGERV